MTQRSSGAAGAGRRRPRPSAAPQLSAADAASTAGVGVAHDVTMSQLLASARRTASVVRWYWRGITGADAYERYVDHLRRTHPDSPIPSEKQFWRDKYAEMERNPTTRCC